MADGPPEPLSVTCREIVAGMLESLLEVLCEGFPERSRALWSRAVDRLAARRVPEGYPRFGYLLMSGSTPVGCLLTIFSGSNPVRCNFSAFYAQARFRPYASLLTLRALRHREVTYLNISPRPNTFDLTKALGYERYSQGSLMFAPALLRPLLGVETVLFESQDINFPRLTDAECQLLADHAGFGCVSLVCRNRDTASPFVFQHRRVLKRLLPAAQLIYCRSIEDFAAHAGNLGRYFVTRGSLLMLADSDGATPALPGRLLNLPRYFKGPVRPRLGDLSYTELPILGI